MAAEHLQGLWPCSAAEQPNPADLPGWEFYSWRENHRGAAGQGYPNQGLEEEIPRILDGLFATVVAWYHKDTLRSVRSSVRSTKGGLKGPGSSGAPNLCAGATAGEAVSLSPPPLGLPHGKESCSASLAIDLTASTRKWTSLSPSLPQQIFLIFKQDFFCQK